MAFFSGVPGVGTEMVSKMLAGATPATAGPGFLSKLFGNPLFLQILGNAGQDLIGKPLATNAGLQQNIASRGYMKLLQQMLAGDMSGGGKISLDESGMKVHIPTPVEGSGATKGTTQASSLTMGQGGGQKFINPFGNGQSISAADLAGVSPELISQAVQFRMMQDQFGEKKVMDLVDAMLRAGQLDVTSQYYQGLLANQQSGQELEAERIGIARANTYLDYLKEQNKDTRTTSQQDYEYAVSRGYKGSFPDWKVLSGDPASWEEYQKTVAQGNKESYRDFLLRVKKSDTTINLGPVEKAEALANIAGKLYFKDPDWTKDLDSYLASDSTDDEIYSEAMTLINQGRTLEEATTVARAHAINKYITQKITGGDAGGTIVGEPRMEGRTRIWTVRWRDGTTSEIRYTF